MLAIPGTSILLHCFIIFPVMSVVTHTVCALAFYFTVTLSYSHVCPRPVLFSGCAPSYFNFVARDSSSSQGCGSLFLGSQAGFHFALGFPVVSACLLCSWWLGLLLGLEACFLVVHLGVSLSIFSMLYGPFYPGHSTAIFSDDLAWLPFCFQTVGLLHSGTIVNYYTEATEEGSSINQILNVMKCSFLLEPLSSPLFLPCCILPHRSGGAYSWSSL